MNSIRVFLCFLSLFVIIHSAGATLTLPTRDPFTPCSTINTTQSENPSLKLQSTFIPVYFAKATEIVSFFSNPKYHILSSQGMIHADKQTNQLWIQDDSKHIALVHSLLQQLDQSGPEFLIKAKIINLDRQYRQSLGVLFRTSHSVSHSMKSLTMDEPRTDSDVGEFTIGIAKLSADHLLDLQISALEQEGHATLISSPALVTLNQMPAIIQSGAEIPYQETTYSGGTSVSFKKAVLQLKVTPEIIPNHRILLHIALNQDAVSALTVNGVPAIQTQQITTQVIVNNHQTIVLGGILETTQSKQTTGIPIINNIPIIGQILRHRTHETKQEELLIFITPEELTIQN